MNDTFCTRCGSRIGEDGVCPTCGASYQDDRKSGKGSFSLMGFLFGWLGCVRSFFSRDPSKSVDTVISDGKMWMVFGVLNVIVSALATASVYSNGVEWVKDRYLGSAISMYLDFLGEGKTTSPLAIFFFSLVTLTGCLAAFAGIQYFMCTLERKRLPLIKTFKAVTICYFPMTIMGLLAFIFSGFLFPVSVVFILIGMLGSITMLNDFVRRTAGELSFWIRVLCNAAQIIAAVVILSISVSVV